MFVDEVNISESEMEINSYLWFNLETMTSELTVSCDNGDFQEWTLKPIGMCIYIEELGTGLVVMTESHTCT